MGDFTQLHPDPDTASFIFRINVPAATCRVDWNRTAEEVEAWAEENHVVVKRRGGQTFFVERGDNADFERASFLFKLRWC